MSFKALLVGINAYPSAPLRGCVNDITEMHKLLKQRNPTGKFQVLADHEATADAILSGLAWLAEPDGGTTGGGTRVFHFSGHGTFVADKNGDERDGRDECICPYDYASGGLLDDDRLHHAYQRFDRRDHLLLVMDSCHSGTVQRDPESDRVYRFILPSKGELRKCARAAELADTRRAEWMAGYAEGNVAGLKGASTTDFEALIQDAVRKAARLYDRRHYGLDTVRGNGVLIAGCRSDQTSADARFGSVYHGALTYYLLQALRSGTPTYRELIAQVGDSLAEDGFMQVPQLECSSKNRKARFLNADT
jgi:hypothetical protein